MALAGWMLHDPLNADQLELGITPGRSADLEPVPKVRFLKAYGQYQHFRFY